MYENGTDAKLPQESDLKGNNNFISFEPIPFIMKPLLTLFLASIILCSCHSGTAPADQTRLTFTAIYNIDSIRLATASGDEKAARKQLLAAVNAYKNDKDPAKSVDLFKKSILLKPSAEGYYGLGSALLDLERYNEALSALHIAEKLEYKPLANVMFKLSTAYANVKDMFEYDYQKDSAAMHYMELALQMGYGHPEEFVNNPRFEGARGRFNWTAVYKTVLNAGTNSKDPELALWEEYKNEFQPIQLPLTINNAWINDHPLEKDIAFDYEKFVPEMRTSKFSREVDKQYYYFAIIKKDTAYTTLLYGGKHVSLESEHVHAPVFFFLVSYDTKGKIIDKLEVAGQQNFTDFVKVFTLQPNYTFEVSDFKNVYRDNPEEVGYDSNVIVKTDPVGVTHYRIGAGGRFEKTDAPLALR